jgi:hypothetical protein
MASSGAGGDHDDSNEMYNLFSRITHPSSRFNREMYDSVRELMFYLSHPSSRNILGDYSIRIYSFTAPAPAPELRRQSSYGLHELLEAHLEAHLEAEEDQYDDNLSVATAETEVVSYS